MMKKKGLLGLIALVGLFGVGLGILSPALTKDRGDEFAMALDNVNPMVAETTVYALTNQPIDHHLGQMGEDVYTYRLRTSDGQGKRRWLTFTADHRLKQRHYLKIDTKGQNVNSWEAVTVSAVPQRARQALKS
ncbi:MULTISPECIES: YxeA family protein [Lactiplantibacillus]|uniref:YxeA family protein n=3 Tax=Lactiplantibacillus pentosus TaxID=1589 RepID=A0AAW8WCX4_LACPE|nr:MULTISPECIES: YxeA family protein [Lactiplantibacillus]MCJ8183108.1 YxeA family protein [Lactiplantibacillus pentosus]MDT7035421.1 YxeA family protein [Lactiplantibacillus pentosus]MDT7038497.1 YxeA family protein [Lactiplantibacillus pentosus]